MMQTAEKFICSKCGGIKVRHKIPLWSEFNGTDPKCRHHWVKEMGW
jgi:hypothetical protein